MALLNVQALTRVSKQCIRQYTGVNPLISFLFATASALAAHISDLKACIEIGGGFFPPREPALVSLFGKKASWKCQLQTYFVPIFTVFIKDIRNVL